MALKLAVLERHGRNGNIGRGWVTGFGPLRGAIASSIGHDSHNLIVAGDDEADMAVAVNHLIGLQGGAAVVRDGRVLADLPLPVAGLMSDRDFHFVETKLRPLRARCGRMRLHHAGAGAAAGFPAAAGDSPPQADRPGLRGRRPGRPAPAAGLA